MASTERTSSLYHKTLFASFERRRNRRRERRKRRRRGRKRSRKGEEEKKGDTFDDNIWSDLLKLDKN